MTAALGIEIAKTCRLRVWPLLLLLPLAVWGVTVVQTFGSAALGALDDPDGYVWKLLLASEAMAFCLIAPLLLAMLASRVVDIEHTDGGWLLSSTAGVTPGSLLRAKFGVLGSLVALGTLAATAGLAVFGLVIGVSTPFPTAQWLGFAAMTVVINLAVLAFHLVLSARVENQLVGLAVGVVGILIATFSQVFPPWAAHLIPWGYYGLATPADFVGTDLVWFDVPYAGGLALAIAGAVLFGVVTRRFDRLEG